MNVQQLMEAEDHLKKGDVAAALKACKKILAKEPKSWGAYCIKGSAESLMGDTHHAIQSLNRARQFSSTYESKKIIGTAFVKAGEYLAAMNTFHEALVLKRDDIELYRSLHELYKKTGTAEAGLAFLMKAIGFENVSLSVVALYSDLFRVTGRYDDARKTAEALVAHAPHEWNFLGFLAGVLAKEKSYTRIIKLMDDILATSTLDKQGRYFCEEFKKDVTMVHDLTPGLNTFRLSGKGIDANTGIRDEWERAAVGEIQKQLVPLSAPYSVIFFHVDWSGQHPFLTNENNVDYKGTLRAAVAAVKKSNPNAAALIITDKQSEFGQQDFDAAHLVRLDLRPEQMMYSRMRAYRALVMSGLLAGPAIFADTDLFLNRDFAPLFQDDFDIAACPRFDQAFWHMPVNEGLIMAKDGKSEKTARFFGSCLNLYEWMADQPAVKQRYPFDIRMWRGGQLSLGAFFNWDVHPTTQRAAFSGIVVRFLPSEDFNYPVHVDDHPNFLRAKWAIHFKGAKAKTLISRYGTPDAQA